MQGSLVTGDWLARAARVRPDCDAIVDREVRYTVAMLAERAAGLSGWLSRSGVRRGERVGILARNGVEYVDAFFACARIGATLVPYNWRLHPRELATLVARTSPRIIVTDEASQAVLAACEPMPQLLRIGQPYEAALGTLPALDCGVEAEEIACLLFSGGTTGRPKAARISHRMIAWNILNTLIHEVGPTDVTCVHMPMFHAGGLLVYLLPILAAGGRSVLMSRWDADDALRHVEQERVTLMVCVPSQVEELLLHPRFADADLSSLRFVAVGGAPLPPALVARWMAMHSVPLKQGFGMTEFGPGLFSMPADAALERAGTIGRPNLFVDVELRDDAGRPVRTGDVGELWLRGPVGFSGYHDEPSPFDAAGWFRTGDLLREDTDGWFTVAGRRKDMYISGGENVYPAEIEAALHEHPRVKRCAVVGVPDDRWGEVGRAFVVVDGAIGEAELRAFLSDRIARYKLPKQFQPVTELPLTAAGKVDRVRLKEMV